jgi:hypothetical protein
MQTQAADFEALKVLVDELYTAGPALTLTLMEV